MELSARDMNNRKAVGFVIGELVAIKGVVFRVTSMSVNPPKFEVSPGNADHIKQYLNKTQPENVSKPSLSEPAKAPEQPPAPPVETQTDPDPAGGDTAEQPERDEKAEGPAA